MLTMIHAIKDAPATVFSAIAELYHTPLALPIALAIIWRAYANRLDIPTLIKAFFIGAMVVVIFPSSVPDFLDLQRKSFEGLLIQFPPETRDLVKSWHVETRFLSPRAAIFGYTFFVLVVTQSKQRPWYKDWGLLFLMLFGLTILTIAWWFIVFLGLSAFRISDSDIEQAIMNQLLSHRDITDLLTHELLPRFRRGIEYYADAPVLAAGFAMCSWVVGAFAFTFIQKHRDTWLQARHYRILDKLVGILITVIILAFALSGFLFLNAYQATLWLFFWIVAYPGRTFLHERASVARSKFA